MSIWILDSGTAGLFNLFGQRAGFPISLYAQDSRNGEGILGRGIFEQATTPQRPYTVLLEGATIETRVIVR
jgi:hypothetical protein